MGKKSKKNQTEKRVNEKPMNDLSQLKSLLNSKNNFGTANSVVENVEKGVKSSVKPERNFVGKYLKGNGKEALSDFINPYIFLPIDEEKPDRNRNDIGSLSGVIECSLDVKSDVFIPNTGKNFKYIKKQEENKKDKIGDHHFSEFFSYEDLSKKEENVPYDAPKFPRIPGSELRGVIRNIYEQLTNSCFSVIDKQNLTNMRTSTPKEAGLWDMATNTVYQAERVMLNTRGKSNRGVKIKTDTYNSGDRIYIKKSKDTYKTNKGIDTKFYIADNISATEKVGYIEGYVLIGEDFPKKHHDSVLIKTQHTVFSMDGKDLSRFENVLKKYNGIQEHQPLTKGCGQYKSYINYYLDCKKRKSGIIPIFYSEVTDISGKLKVHYVAPAMITREYFSHTVSEILKKNAEHQPCDGSKGWCPACQLFGMIDQNQNREDTTNKLKALASRLRFTDSDVIKDAEFTKPRILPILGSPRISSPEFYLKKPKGKANFWNYDYYTDDTGKKLYEPILKGRKVYWLGKSKATDVGITEAIYNKDGELRVSDNVPNLKQRTAVRSLKNGNTTFKVFFEDLTQEELDCLLFCLQLKEFGTNDSRKIYHRIGRGKPYGMGAVEIKVDKLKLYTYELVEDKIERSLDEKEREHLDQYNLEKYGQKYLKAKEQIQFYSQQLSTSEAKLIDYPKAKDKKGNITTYLWFANNRGSIAAPKIQQCLPEFDSLMDRT